MIVCYRCHHPGCSRQHFDLYGKTPADAKCEKCGRNHRLLMMDCDYAPTPGEPVEDAPTPVCPHCGEYEDDMAIWADMGIGDYDGAATEVTCHRCEREYEVETHVSYTFTTKPIAATEVAHG